MNPGCEADASLKRALAASEEDRASSKRQLTELQAAYVQLAASHAETKEALGAALRTEVGDALAAAVHDMVMAQTPSVLMGEALVATHAATDLVAHMQTVGSKTVLSLAVYSPMRGYTQYCSEENTVGYRSGTSKLDAAREEVRKAIEQFVPSTDDQHELFERQRPVDAYDASKHTVLVSSLVKARQRAAREALRAPTSDAVSKQIKLLTTHVHRSNGLVELDVLKDCIACVNGIIVRDPSSGLLVVRAWRKSDLISRNTGVDVASLLPASPQDEPLTLDGYTENFTSRSLTRFLCNAEAREFVTTLFMHRALGHHQKFGLLFLGPANVGKSTHILLLLSAYGGTACMAATEAFKTDSNAALNAFTNSSTGRVIVYIDDLERRISESALKRTGNGVPILTRRPGSGEPTRPQRPALVVMSANPDTVQTTLSKSVQPKLVVVPPVALASPVLDSGIDLIDYILDGVYAIESLEFQLRCYNSAVLRSAPFATALEPPPILKDASAELEAHSKVPAITPEMDAAFHRLVDPILQKRSAHKYVRAEELKSAILSHPVDAKLLQITKTPGYSFLKIYMSTLYNVKFVQTARLSGHANPVPSCFLNPMFDSVAV